VGAEGDTARGSVLELGPEAAEQLETLLMLRQASGPVPATAAAAAGLHDMTGSAADTELEAPAVKVDAAMDMEGAAACAAAEKTEVSADPDPMVLHAVANPVRASAEAVLAAADCVYIAANADVGGGEACSGTPEIDGAMLVSLALEDVPPPPPENAAAVATSSAAAYREVERAAEALRLPPAKLDAVLSAVEASLDGGPACHQFLGMSYRRLRRAAAAGDVAAAMRWMEQIGVRHSGSGNCNGNGAGTSSS
jgi:hypothetical protein